MPGFDAERRPIPWACACRLPLALAICLGSLATAYGEDAPTSSTGGGLWTAHVLPLLQKKCFRCHGGATQKSELDVRTPAAILKGGERGPAVVRGKPGESLIFKVVQPGAELSMPPDKKNVLSAEEILLLRRWIERGATERESGDWKPAASEASPRSSPDVVLPPSGLSPHLVIDFLIESGWKERGVSPARRCDDRTFVRRVYLDLAGRIPATAEARAFLDDTRSDKRRRLVDRLLEGPEYPRRMREVFDVVLMGRENPEGASRRRSRGRREDPRRWREYLQWAFRIGRPWDQIVGDLLLARPTRTEERGAVSFLRAGRNRHQKIAERVSPALFGLQVQCAQCHDHPVAPEIEQRHYWGLVSFFSRSTNVDTGEGPGVAESAVGGFSKFADLAGENHDAVLAFFNGKVVPEERPAEGDKQEDNPEKYLIPPPANGEKAERAPVPRFSRRAELFKLAANSGLLARSFVNRIWALLMGRGLVHPVDKMDSAHPPSHPRLLAWLARDFIESGYDIRRLVRAIVSSRAYQLDSRIPTETVQAQPAAFAHGLDKPLTAEALYRSLLIASGRLSVADGRAETLDTSVATQFAAVFPDVFPEEKISNLRQALFLTNNPAVDALLEPTAGGTTARLAAIPDTKRLVEEAFEIVFGRSPDVEELERSVAYIDARRDARTARVKQLLWAMMTSAEFRMTP